MRGRPRRSCSTPAASPTPRAAEPAPLVPRHRRPQHRHRRRPRPDALRAQPAERARRRRALPRPQHAPGLDVLAGEVRSPVYEAVHRRRIAFVRRPLLDRRGPRSTASASIATTCASTSPPGRRAGRRHGAARAGVTLRSSAPRDRDRARLDLAALRRARAAPVVSAVAAGRGALRDPDRRRSRARSPRRDAGELDADRVVEPATGDELLAPDPRSRSATRCWTRATMAGSARAARAHRREVPVGAARTSTTDGESAAAYERRSRAPSRAPPARRRSCTQSASAVLWTFPNDRKLASLPLLADGSASSPGCSAAGAARGSSPTPPSARPAPSASTRTAA